MTINEELVLYKEIIENSIEELKLQYKTKQTSLTKKNPTIKNLKKSKYYKENITKIDKTTIKELNKICNKTNKGDLKLITYRDNINQNINSLNINSNYIYSNSTKDLIEKRDKIKEPLSEKQLYRIITDTSNLKELDNETLLQINLYLLNKKFDMDPTRFAIYFQRKESINETMVKDFTNHVNKSKKEIKKILGKFEVVLPISEKEKEELTETLKILANNKISEVKSWLILFKEDYDLMSEEQQKEVTKDLPTLLNYINECAMNGNKPFKEIKENPLRFSFQDGGSGKIDTLYRNHKGQLSAIDTTVDDKGQIDRTLRGQKGEQQLTKHFYKYLLYTKINLDNPGIDVHSLNNLVNAKYEELYEEEYTPSNINKLLAKEIKELLNYFEEYNKENKDNQVELNYVFFPDINLQPKDSKFLKTLHHTFYSYIHINAGRFEKDTSKGEIEEIELGNLLTKYIKTLTLEDSYTVLELQGKKRSEDKNKKGNDSIKQKHNDFMFEENGEHLYEILFEYLLYFTKELHKSFNGTFDIKELTKEKIQSIQYSIIELNEENQKEGKEDLYTYLSATLRGETNDNVEFFTKNFSQLFLDSKIRQQQIGDFIYYNLTHKPEEYNKLSRSEKIFMKDMFSGVGTDSEFNDIFKNSELKEEKQKAKEAIQKAKEATQKAKEATQKVEEEKENGILLQFLPKIGLDEYVIEEDFEVSLKENIDYNELFNKIIEKANQESQDKGEKIKNYLFKNLSNIFKEQIKNFESNKISTKDFGQKIKEILSNPLKNPKRPEEVSEDKIEEAKRQQQNSTFRTN